MGVSSVACLALPGEVDLNCGYLAEEMLEKSLHKMLCGSRAAETLQAQFALGLNSRTVNVSYISQ